MSYRISPDGTLVVDTLDELLAYQAASLGARPHTPADQPRAWTKPLVESFLAQVSSSTRDLVLALLVTGGGLSTADFATQAELSTNSLGHRFSKLQRHTRDFAPSLPTPARLRGKPGVKVVEVDPTFVTAAMEAAL